MSDVANALENFIQRFENLGEGALPKTAYDSDWPSPCQRSDANQQGWINWTPTKLKQQADFSQLEQALELQLHPDIKTFFGLYYSDVIGAETTQGNLQLLFTWSEQDFKRLQENIIGHVLMKRRLGQPVTVFFAVTDEEDWFLSLDNDSGNVLLETPGKVPEKVIATSLAEFLQQLTPIFP